MKKNKVRYDKDGTYHFFDWNNVAITCLYSKYTYLIVRGFGFGSISTVELFEQGHCGSLSWIATPSHQSLDAISNGSCKLCSGTNLFRNAFSWRHDVYILLYIVGFGKNRLLKLIYCSGEWSDWWVESSKYRVCVNSPLYSVLRRNKSISQWEWSLWWWSLCCSKFKAYFTTVGLR